MAEAKDLMQRTCNTIQALLHMDYDCPVVIDGMEGDGKSILALKVSSLIDPDFRLDRRHIVFRFGNLRKSIYGLPRFSCIQHDEMGLSAFNRQAMTKFNIELVQALIVCRDQNKALVACVPSIWILDPYIKNHRARYWFHVYVVEYKDRPIRGFVQIRKAVPNLWGEKPFWKLLGIYRFKNVNDEVGAAYRQLKHEALQEQADQKDDGSSAAAQRDRDRLITALASRSSISEMSKDMGLKYRTMQAQVKASRERLASETMDG